MKKIYKTPSLLWLDIEEEYGYCADESLQAVSDPAVESSQGTEGGSTLVKTITMDDPSNDEW